MLFPHILRGSGAEAWIQAGFPHATADIARPENHLPLMVDFGGPPVTGLRMPEKVLEDV